MSTETRKKGGDLRSVFAHISIYIAALLFASPLIYAVFSAMKPNNEMFTSPPRLIGSQIKWTNFIGMAHVGIMSPVLIAAAVLLAVIASAFSLAKYTRA